MAKLIGTYKPLTLEDIRGIQELLVSPDESNIWLGLSILQNRDWNREPFRSVVQLMCSEHSVRTNMGHSPSHRYVFVTIARPWSSEWTAVRAALWSE